MRLALLLLGCMFSSGLFGQALLKVNSDKALASDSAFVEKEAKKPKEIKSPEVEFNIGKAEFKMDLSARLQLRYDIIDYKGTTETDYKFKVRRSRIKSGGYIFSSRLEYKIQYDIQGESILDAVLKWKIKDNFSISAGQTKISGNRGNLISSQKLQFVDRSLLNSNFNLDRDLGVWISHDQEIGGVLLRKTISITKGEGHAIFKNSDEPLINGLSYTGRIDVMPFGKFTNKGAYFGGDLVREKDPKLALALSYNFNNNAIKTKGHIGDITDKSADITTWFIDAMFKYRGLSYMGEYAYRSASDINVPATGGDDLLFFEGQALNQQIGYLLPYNFEVATRLTVLKPANNIGGNNINEYSLALSKYIIGHQLKVQTDMTLHEEANNKNQVIYRLQVELSF